MRDTRGITLIALVITIVVLLILAGIVINLTIGQNGIIRRAQEAGKNYMNAANYEQILLSEFDDATDNIIKNIIGNDEELINYPTLTSKAQVGDYVKYDSGNGYTDLWRVLYNDNTYGLQIISTKSVRDLKLGGDTEEGAKEAYNNVIDTLNSYCEKYINNKYATSGRSVGSNPLNPRDIVTDVVTLPFEYNESNESGCKVEDKNYKYDYTVMTMIDEQNSGSETLLGDNYWLASRKVNITDSQVDFMVWCIGPNGEMKCGDALCVTPWSASPFSGSLGIRPVITLKSGIKTSAGEGSKEKPFELVAQ